jgi:hypothetical protein
LPQITSENSDKKLCLGWFRSFCRDKGDEWDSGFGSFLSPSSLIIRFFFGPQIKAENRFNPIAADVRR